MNQAIPQKGDEFSLNLQNTISQNEFNQIKITNIPVSQHNCFIPKNNLFYCYFTESKISKKASLIIKYAIDIQRFCYYPGTTNIYTFVGFSDQNQRDQATRYQKLINYSTNKIIYKYVQNIQEIINFFQKGIDKNAQNKNNKSKNNTKETKKYKEFNPKENLTYFYFHEPKKTDVERLKNLNHPIYHIYTAQDVQLYCYYPGTNKLYSFFGFLDKEEGIRAFKSSRAVMANYLIGILSNSKLNKKNGNGSITRDTEKTVLFKPNDKFYYLYFKEIKLNENDKFDDVDGVADLQRKCRLNSKDSNCYTFLGFLHSIQRICALKILKNKTSQIDTKSIKMIDDDDEEHNEDGDENEDNEGNSNDSKLNEDENPNTRFHYSPDQDLNSNIEIKSDTKKSKKDKKQFVYNPEQNTNSKTVNSITSKLALSPEKEKETQNEIDVNKQIISPSLLPIFNSYSNLGFKFGTFVPKEKLLYCFLAEVNKPSYRSVYEKFDQLFGITNASDIQRFCFYPGTENVYTFVGFSDQSKLNQSIQKSSFRSAAINCQIFSFPYEKAIVKPKTENQTETSQKKSKKAKNSKFVYNPDNETTANDRAESQKSDNDNKDDKINNQFNNNINENADGSANKNQKSGSSNNDSINYSENQTKTPQKISKKAKKSKFVYNPDNENTPNDRVENPKSGKDNTNDKTDDQFNNNNDDDDDDDDDNFNSNDQHQHHSDTQISDSLFDQNDEIFYLFFKEKNSEVRNLHLNNTQLFGINNIVDMQRGYQLKDGDSNFYTFLGFSQCMDLASAFKILKEKPDEIDISTLQILGKGEDDDDAEDDDDDDDDADSVEDGDETLDFDEIFDSDEVIQNVHRNEKISPQEKIKF